MSPSGERQFDRRSSRGRRWIEVLACLGLCVGLFGCPSEPDIDERRCVPGRAVACQCVDGRSGHRICDPSGSLGPCRCGEATDTGGGPADTGPDTDGTEGRDAVDGRDGNGTGDTVASDTGGDGETSDGSGDTTDGDGGGLPGKQACPPPSSAGSTHYVAPDGSADAAGTESDPFDVQTGVDAAKPGDHVVFLPGTYTDGIAPSSSGTAGQPIVFRSEPPLAATLTEGNGGNSKAVGLDNVSHIRISGFHLETGAARWIRVVDSDHIELRDLVMEGHDGVGVPLVVSNSRQVVLADSVIRETEKWAMVRFEGVDRVRIAGNAFGITKSLPLLIENGRDVAVRGNTFANPVGLSFAVRTSNRVLLADNAVTNAVAGPDSRSAFSQIQTTHTIVRFNRFFHNWGSTLRLYGDGNNRAVETMIYRNVWDRAASESRREGGGVTVRAGSGTLQGNVLKNNAFTRLGRRGDHIHFWSDGVGDAGAVRVTNNAFWAESNTDARVSIDRNLKGISTANQQHGGFFDSNVDVEPGYRSRSTFDHRLAANSQLIDAGVPLTRTASAGSGTTVEVGDASYFFDGWGIEAERGDRIAIGSSGDTARIESIDYENETIEIDRSLQWSAGDAVDFPWSGSSPDIGAYERGATARRAVSIRRSSFVTQVGEPVTLRIAAHGGVQPVRARWKLGEGETVCGLGFEHAIEEPGVYPLRVAVEGADGHRYRAADLLVVNGEGQQNETFSYNRRRMNEFNCDGNGIERRSSGGGFQCAD